MRLSFSIVGVIVIALQSGVGSGAWAQSSPNSLSKAVAPSVDRHASHQRLLPLQGGRNFRDLGGYRTRDGRHVKWGLLFRSGSMHGLTAADYGYLETRGIRVVCDFRDSRERIAEPVVWPVEGAPKVFFEDFHLDLARMMPSGPPSSWTEPEARASFAASYPLMLGQFNGQYRRMFTELLAGHAPLAFNCSAGKDRTGIAAALILTALDVPRETVIADYMLTNTYLDTAKMLAQGSAPANMGPRHPIDHSSADPAAALRTMAPGALRAILSADPSYIKAALAVMDHHSGGPSGYLHDELGLDNADIVRLRSLYLE